MNEEEQREFMARLEEYLPLVADGLVAARLGQPGNQTVWNTKKWGPIEGIRDGNVITFTLPDHSEYQVRLLPDYAAEVTLFGRVVGKLGPVTVEAPDAEDES